MKKSNRVVVVVLAALVALGSLVRRVEAEYTCGPLPVLCGTGRPNPDRDNPVCLQLPNSLKCDTATYTSTGTCPGTGTGTGTATRTCTVVKHRVDVADTDFNISGGGGGSGGGIPTDVTISVDTGMSLSSGTSTSTQTSVYLKDSPRVSLTSSVAAGEGVTVRPSSCTATGTATSTCTMTSVYVKDGPVVASAGMVKAVTSGSADYLSNRIEVGEGMSTSVSGTIPDFKVKVSQLRPIKEDVECMFNPAAPSMFSGWTNTSSGVWTKDNVGTISGTSLTDDVTVVAGTRVLAYRDGDSTGQSYYGIYTVTDPGDPTHYAVLTRATDADSAAELPYQFEVNVRKGTYFYGSRAVFLTSDAITLETTPLQFGLYQVPYNATVWEKNLSLTDTTLKNVSTDAHGLQPKLSGDATQYMNGVGTYTVPSYCTTSGSTSWTTFFNEDLTTLTNQNLLPGDGQKTLSDGSHIYVANSSQTGGVVYLYNGSGIRVYATEGTNNTSGIAAYWRIEDMGSSTISKGDWTRIRCSVIASMVTPTNTGYGSRIGAFFGRTTGSPSSGGLFSLSAWTQIAWVAITSNMLSGVAKEGIHAAGWGTPAEAVRSSDTGITVSGSQKDMFTFLISKNTFTAETLLGSSNSGNFPTDPVDSSWVIGTPSFSGGGSVTYDTTGIYATLYAHTGGATNQEIYLKKIWCAYK